MQKQTTGQPLALAHAQQLGQWRALIEAGFQAAALEQMLAQESTYAQQADYWLLRGAALGKLVQTEASLACFDRALTLNPQHETALFNRAEALRFLGDHAEALATLREGVRRFAANPGWVQRLWWAERQVCAPEVSTDARQSLAREQEVAQAMLGAVQAQADSAGAPVWEPDPFAALLLGLPETQQLALARLRAQREALSVAHVRREGEPPCVQRPRRRVGWLSADFHDHATLYLLLEVFEQMDSAHFEQVFYSFGPDFEDGSRQRLRRCGTYVDIATLGAVEAAQRIANDGIDILIDLKGYTAFARPAIMALRPAPVQLQWLGYPGSMGADWIDWIVADAQVLPGADAQHGAAGYSERVLYLPHTYQPNGRVLWDEMAVLSAPERARARQAAGLPAQALVLANFNSPYKTDAQSWDIWMHLLREVPQAVLWLLADHPLAQANLRAAAQAAGVNPARVVLAPKLPRQAHLMRLRLADLALDPLGMGGHTTTSDALRMGLPVLTVAAVTFGRRVAASLLHAAGMADAVLPDPASLLAVLRDWARDEKLRKGLQMRADLARMTTPLFDPQVFARDWQTALDAVWQHKLQSDGRRCLDLRAAHAPAWAKDVAQALEKPVAAVVQQAKTWVEADLLPQARALCEALLQRHPQSANGCALLALVHYRQGRHDLAAALFERAVARLSQPDAQLLHNWASALESGNHFEAAEQVYRQALQAQPDRADTLGQLGCMLRNLGRVDEALVLHQRMLALKPDDAQSVYIYGGSLYQAGKVDESMAVLQQALDLNPQLHEARSNLGICQLLKGAFAQGWEDFEARWHSPQMKGSWAPFPAPSWAGENLNGQAFLAWAEQGLGDNIQFVRYLGVLRLRYPQVRLAFWGPKTLFRLIEGFAQHHQIQLVAREEVPQPAQISGMNFHAPLMGLPRLLGTRLDSIPSEVPAYLSLDAAWVMPWRERVARLPLNSTGTALNVGLVWSGQREGMIVEKRNIHPRTLEPWLDVPGVRWFSLQIGAEQQAQIEGTRWQGQLLDWTSDIKDFADTASLAQALDLVITVDTSTAHAASATGSAVWMLSRADGCWRWLQERSDSPWYPKMRIFRQAKPLQWAPVVQEVAQALRQAVQDKGGGNTQTHTLAKTGRRALPSTGHQGVLDKTVAQAKALSEQGLVKRRNGDLEGAVHDYDAAIALAPQAATPRLLKGFALRMQLRLPEAEACYRQALALEPDNAQCHFNLALVLLLQRRYAEGWAELAWRWRLPGQARPRMPGRLWQGEDLSGQSLLVYQDQGLGDVIQFARYLPLLLQSRAPKSVTLAVRAPLLRLMRESLQDMPVVQVVDLDQPMPAHDGHASIFDLPRCLACEESPALAAYLHAPTERVQRWREWLNARSPAGAPQRRVGLVWRGNPQRLRNDHRSVPADVASALRACQDVQWVSLQVDVQPEDAAVRHVTQARAGAWLEPLQALSDLAETAALVMNLECVVTVDTSVAHLAAALGRPTWVLLAHDSDWRWQLAREDSPWYPTARVLRQPQAGDWASVVAQLMARWP